MEPGTWVDIDEASTGSAYFKNDLDGDGIFNADPFEPNMWLGNFHHLTVSLDKEYTMGLKVLMPDESTETVSLTVSVDDTASTATWGGYPLQQGLIEEYHNHIEAAYGYHELAPPAPTAAWTGNGLLAAMALQIISPVASRGTLSVDFTNKFVRPNPGVSYPQTLPVEFWPHSLHPGLWVISRTELSSKVATFQASLQALIDAGGEILPESGFLLGSFHLTFEGEGMPGRPKDALVTLNFEDGGEAYPIKAFRYQPEEWLNGAVTLVNSQTIGPVDVVLTELVASEIIHAIEKNMTPRLYVVHHRIEHIPNSDYAVAVQESMFGQFNVLPFPLTSVSIELVGSGFNKSYKVPAIETLPKDIDCNDISELTHVAPGASLETQLIRLQCAGHDIVLGDFILDFSGLEPEMDQTIYHTRGIVSIDGQTVVLPGSPILADHIVTDLDDGTEAYYVRPTSEWSSADYDTVQFWIVQARAGRNSSYHPTEDLLDDKTGQPARFRFAKPGSGEEVHAQKIAGISSLTWTQDSYRIFLADLADYHEYLALKE